MSGIFDSVIVIMVPGGPDDVDILTSGLAKVLRSEVAHAKPRIGKIASPSNPKNTIRFNYMKISE